VEVGDNAKPMPLMHGDRVPEPRCHYGRRTMMPSERVEERNLSSTSRSFTREAEEDCWWRWGITLNRCL
jgi:hypothetical protein